MRFIDKMRLLFKKSQEQSPSGQLLKHVGKQLEEISNTLHEQIESQVSGRQGTPAATIEYVLQDRSGEELQTEWQDTDYITYDAITKTSGYQQLMDNVKTSGVNMKLIEEQIEEVDDEDRVRFVLTLSGWS